MVDSGAYGKDGPWDRAMRRKYGYGDPDYSSGTGGGGGSDGDGCLGCLGCLVAIVVGLVVLAIALVIAAWFIDGMPPLIDFFTHLL